MARDTLTGSRIRERRIMAGLRQADLARQIDISASYLNLIEHNRRRIGGKLLLDIARVLQVEPSMLAEGAEAALIAILREAAADAKSVTAETDKADEFAGRFPGWAEVLAKSHRRVASLERTVETLTDRVTHDPQLAASLHEVLSTAAAIRSTASILAETQELEPEWRNRFHRNINEDSARLAESSKALVGYLDSTDAQQDDLISPQEEVEALLADQGHFFAALEVDAPDIRKIIADEPRLTSPAARHVARGVMEQYARDAAAMPLDEFHAALLEIGMDPVALARRFGVPVQSALRRLAAMPEGTPGANTGLVVCDSSGAMLFRKAIEGFSVPRFGTSCPLWPLFSAFSRPMTPICQRVEQISRDASQFDCIAIAHPIGEPALNMDPIYHSTMLIVPASQTVLPAATPVKPVGSTCRVCTRERCIGRREPSILNEGF
jgi:predicted transcriptional regulator/DNA-binding XRE family transcriptional regulator